MTANAQMLKTQTKIKFICKGVTLINTIIVTTHLLIITPVIKQSICISNFSCAALQKQH